MTQNWKSYCWQLVLANYLAIGGVIVAALENSAFAQITPDNTLENGISEVIPFNRNIDYIFGGLVKDSNVFHSFQEFNINQGKAAYFVTETSNVQNIIARVTGNNVSRILGTLGALHLNNSDSIANSNANLFLINPNGIIFGPSASISVGGSFVGSTASGIKFTDGTVFSATDKQIGPLLTVSTPIGLQFGSNPGNIVVQSRLRVSPGKTLALVGGNVTLNNAFFLPRNNVQTSGIQIAIGGITESGTVGLNLDSNNLPLTFPNGVKLGDVSFTKAAINANGNGGGQIQLQGRNITLASGSILSADTTGNQTGRGVFIQSEQLSLKDGSQIRASTRSVGTGGNLTVKVADFVQLSGTDANGNPSALFAETFAQGDAGNLTIETSKLIVEDGAIISAATRQGSQGNGGILTVNASDFVRLSGSSVLNRDRPSGLFAQTQGSGDAGALTIDTRQLIVQNGAQVTAGTLEGSSGNGGTLTVRATDSIELSGTDANRELRSGLYARSRGTGNAGLLKISTRNLTVRDNAQVTVESLGSGNAGNLDIDARWVRLDNEGKITAETRSGQGGNISLRNLDLLLLQDNSQISTDADTSKVGADVAGGNIDIDSKLIVATLGANSDITATAFKGRGGNIDITTNGLFGIEPRDRLTPQNDITAASELGINGTIQINTPDVQPSKGIVALPEEVVDASRAIAQSCSTSVDNKRSEMVITGRGGLPPSPDQPLSSDVVWSDTRLNAITNQAHNSNHRATKPVPSPQALEIVPATGWVFNQQGEVTLIALAPNLAPYSSSISNGSCH